MVVNADARVINLSGKYIIPGLIDGHVHVRLFPDIQFENALRWGITSVRSMGDNAGYIKLINDDNRNGLVNYPDIYFCSMVFGRQYYESNRVRVMQAHAEGCKIGEEPWMCITDSATDF